MPILNAGGGAAAHHLTHEDGSTDEISLTNLSGMPFDVWAWIIALE